MPRKANYDKKIELLEAQVGIAEERLESLRGKLNDLKQKKEEQDYRELLDFMKERNISAEEAVESLMEKYDEQPHK